MPYTNLSSTAEPACVCVMPKKYIMDSSCTKPRDICVNKYDGKRLPLVKSHFSSLYSLHDRLIYTAPSALGVAVRYKRMFG